MSRKSGGESLETDSTWFKKATKARLQTGNRRLHKARAAAQWQKVTVEGLKKTKN